MSSAGDHRTNPQDQAFAHHVGRIHVSTVSSDRLNLKNRGPFKKNYGFIDLFRSTGTGWPRDLNDGVDDLPSVCHHLFWGVLFHLLEQAESKPSSIYP